ncbi:MAG: UDP-N-acetylmuramate dehydrogenase [Candidatus Cloacimonadales bacterium]
MPESVSDLAKLIFHLSEAALDFLPLGAGSNLLLGKVENCYLISDKQLPRSLQIEENEIVVSANFNINALIHALLRYDLGGLSFLSGIPAHLGGLVKMNAGAYGASIGDFVKWVKLIDKSGRSQQLDAEQICFSYRSSKLSGFIYEICLRLEPVAQIAEKEKVLARIDQRRKSQPLNYPNLGCFFKNPPDESAGRLIDECGLKGCQIGGASVSEKHANFIINRDNATFGDTRKLMNLVKNEVYNKFKIKLEEEIEVIGI